MSLRALSILLALPLAVSATAEEAGVFATLGHDPGGAQSVFAEAGCVGDRLLNLDVLRALENDRSTTPARLRRPASPAGASLLLLALGSAGIWSAGRAARHALSGAPDWIHTGGPRRVGHSAPIDLSFSLAALPPRVFEQPSSTAAFRDRLPDLFIPRTCLAFAATRPRSPPAYVRSPAAPTANPRPVF